MHPTPITNRRKARCRHCRQVLPPGKGIRFEGTFAYANDYFYCCPTCADARQKRDANDAAVEANLEIIAAKLEQYYGHPADTTPALGFISLKNEATTAYDKMWNLIYASGIYALEASQTIVQAFANTPKVCQDVSAHARNAALGRLAQIYMKQEDLPLAKPWLIQQVAEKAQEQTRKDKVPSPGDLVRLTKEHQGLPTDSLGIINGYENVHQERLDVTFCYQMPFRGTNSLNGQIYVIASGGPICCIPAGMVEATGESFPTRFWRWKDQPGGKAENYIINAAVWKYNPCPAKSET